MVMDCIIAQEVKDLTKKYTSLYGPGGIFHSGSLFTLFYMVMCCNIIQEVKGLRNKLFYCLGGRPWSFYAKFLLVL